MKNKNGILSKDSQSYESALIYCRVSSMRQKIEGNGLDSQEHRCREYAKDKGYEVDAVFRDSFTGGGDFMKRPAMSKLLDYVDGHPHKNYVVIFDDLKRFARDREFHFKLRTALKIRSVKPECLNYNFDDSPEGVFVETIFAAQGQLEKDQNKRQVVQKMKARLERGYWPFYPVAGYTNIKDPIHGKLLSPVSPTADVVREALEGFASGRFQDIIDVLKFLRSKNFFRKYTAYHFATTKRLLMRPEYAGYIEYPQWGVTRRQGHHKAIISQECFAKIQDRLNGRVLFRYREDVDSDFPLRGFVLCENCGKELTSSWCSGRHAKYPYYRCVHNECSEKNKSIKRVDLEDAMKGVLQKVTPKQELLDFVVARLVLKWKNVQSRINDSRKEADESVSKIQERIDSLVRMIDVSKSPAVNQAYEKQIEELGQQELLAKERMSKIADKKLSFETALSTVMEPLKNPCDYWQNGDLMKRRLLLKMVFSEKIAYSKTNGFETASLSLPIKVFERFSSSKCHQVEVPTSKSDAKKELKWFYNA